MQLRLLRLDDDWQLCVGWGKAVSESGSLEVYAEMYFEAADPLIEIAFLGATLRLNQIYCQGERALPVGTRAGSAELTCK